MTGRCILSPRAESDFDAIWDYTAKRWGLDQAETYTRQLWRDMQGVAAQPTIARSCSEVREGYYKYFSGSHVIFFRLTDGGIDVVRILHERMDFERHL